MSKRDRSGSPHVYPWDDSRQDCLFPPEIEEDSWVLFHGTSNLAEQSIEDYGFHGSEPVVSRSDLLNVLHAFERLQWVGNDGGGLPVLLPFSLRHDRPRDGSNAVAFAETSHRALNFATRDFAGGEAARAVRKAMSDLELYASDSLLQEEHRAALTGGYRPPVMERRDAEVDDLRWLGERLQKLRPLKDRVEHAFAAWEYGVVYAVQFSPDDLGGLRNTSSMGVLADQTVPRDLIVGKIRTDGDFEYRPFAPRRDLPAAFSGVIDALTARKNG